MSKEEIKKYLTEYLKKKGVLRASIFGSLAREENSSASDIDILVKLDKNKTLLDLIGLKLELEELLNQKVDILTYNSLHPLIRENVLKDAEILYE